MSLPLLSLENCRVSFGAVTALNGAMLQVESGESVGLVGPLGSGKTTLLRLVAGLVDAQGGHVVFDGREIRSLSTDQRARRGIIHVPADGGIFPSLTVRENLFLAQPHAGTPDELRQMQETFPVLGERVQQRAGSLSGGEQRQLAIARGVLARPRLLLLDEPLLGLSPTTVRRVVGLLDSLHRAGVAMIVVEERPTDELRALADRMVGMRAGRLGPASLVETAEERRSQAQGSLDGVDIEVVAVPLSTRERRALQTIAQAEGRPVGELIAGLVRDHVQGRQEVWR